MRLIEGACTSVRLLIIAPENYPVPSIKGTSVETCIFNIATHLAKEHCVTVVSRSVKHLPRVSSYDGLRIIRIAGGARRKYIVRALRAVAGQRFDHIQIDNRPGFVPIVRKSFPRTPLSLFLHSLTFVTRPRASSKRVRAQLSHTDMIISNSMSLKSCLSELYPGQGKKIRVVHLGVSASRFRPPTALERVQARRERGVSHSFAVLFVGRFIPLKGIPLLIEAAQLVYEEVPSTKLLLVGSGKEEYVSYIRSLARRVNVPVEFIGPVLWNKMPHVYWAADCFVCPTQGHEAFGLVVVEALSSGLPAVASHNGGIKEIVRHNTNGLLIEDYGNPQRFADAIIAIAKNPDLAKRLGQGGRDTSVNQFSWEKAGESLQRLYFGGEQQRGRNKAP